jgi:hypothetical protein
LPPNLAEDAMARRSKQSVLKRQRERKKAEKAAAKREDRLQREGSGEAKVADQDDLAGYGLVVEEEEVEETT